MDYGVRGFAVHQDMIPKPPLQDHPDRLERPDVGGSMREGLGEKASQSEVFKSDRLHQPKIPLADVTIDRWLRRDGGVEEEGDLPAPVGP